MQPGSGDALAPRATSLPRPPALTILMQIVVAALSGGVFATVAAAGTLVLHRSWISRIVSFAVGALLGAVFLELLPHALETGDAERVMATVLVGLLAFFALEKLVLWRHAHGHDAHEDDGRRVGARARAARGRRRTRAVRGS